MCTVLKMTNQKALGLASLLHFPGWAWFETNPMIDLKDVRFAQITLTSEDAEFRKAQ